MFKLVGTVWRRLVLDEAPAEIDKCLECGKLNCKPREFQACEARKQRQADIENARRASTASANASDPRKGSSSH